MLDFARKLMDALRPAVMAKASALFPEAFDPKPGDYVWHVTTQPLWPRKTVEGYVTRSEPTLWRRRRPDGVWEFQQTPETVEAQMDRII